MKMAKSAWGVMKVKLLLLICISLMSTGCDENFSPKEFMFLHPEVRFQFDGKGVICDKYSSSIAIDSWCKSHKEGMLVAYVGEQRHEVFLKKFYQFIGDTNFAVRFR